jgi:hypothetical protein
MTPLRPSGYHIAPAALLLLWLFAAGCSTEQKRPEAPPPRRDTVVADLNDTTFHIPSFPEGRRLDTVIRIDPVGKASPSFLVASIAEDTARYVSGRADLWQLYTYDPLIRHYSVAFLDSAQWATGFRLEDLTGDGKPELIVPLNGGGNDIVATMGLRVYSFDGGLHQIYGSDSGDPTISGTGGRTTIELHAELWPSFASHADAHEYLDDIHAYRDGRFTSIRTEQRARFITLAQGYLKEYAEERPNFTGDTLTGGVPPDSDIPHALFRPAAMAVLCFGRGGDLRSMRSFWGSERAYLSKRMPNNQFLELETIYARMLDT